jgi:hypothetical protein
MAMSPNPTNDDIIVDPEKWLLREQARIMLELFEEERQQPAATMDEIREWANAQDQETLKFRIDRRLDIILDLYDRNR